MDQTEIARLRRAMEYENARKAPPPDFPKLPDLPGARYTDQHFYALEKAHLWRKSWLLAGHIDEVPEPGCFKLWEMAEQPILLVHARSGAINAFYNTCRHRGAPVVREATGKRQRLSCGYHGWTYDDEGRLMAVRDREDFPDLDLGCRGLERVRAERFGNLIFVNFDESAPGLREYLGPIAEEWEEFQFDRVRLVDRYVIELVCNWKIAMEANLEVYHVPNIHPNNVALIVDDRRNVNTLYPGGHGRMIAPNRATSGETAIRSVRLDFPELTTVGEIARTCTQSYNIMPNWVSPLSQFGFPVLLFWPAGLAKTRFEVWWFGGDWGAGQRPAGWDDYIKAFNLVLDDDTQFGNWIQKSVQSYGFKGVPLSYQEARIYHFHQAADAAIGRDNIPAALRVAPVIGPDWVWPHDIASRLDAGAVDRPAEAEAAE